MGSERDEWKKLKTAYKASLAGIKFEYDYGPLLDAVAKVTANVPWKDLAKNIGQLNDMLTAGGVYHRHIKEAPKMPEADKKALLEFLDKVDAKYRPIIKALNEREEKYFSRAKWSAIKDAAKDELKKKKVELDMDFGPMLDEYWEALDKRDSQRASSYANELRIVVRTYLARLKQAKVSDSDMQEFLQNAAKL